MTRRSLALGFALLVTAVGAGPAAAAAPVEQRAELDSGTAILQYSEAGDAGQEAARQAGLRTSLGLLDISPDFFEALPMVAVRGPASALRAAARSPGVVAAHPNRRLAYELYQSTPLVFGGQQEQMAAAGFDGRGVNVAIVDSGVDALHADLADHVVENYEVAGGPGDAGDPGVAVVQECLAPGNACDTDENGHGTHVAGIATGDGTASNGFHRGVAPGAGVVGYSVGVGPTILSAVAAYDHILAHPELGVVVVNSSFGVSGGGRFNSTDPVNQATKRLNSAGIVTVFSNGNSGANADGTPTGSSDCAKDAPDGLCKTNPYSVAPWVMSAAGGRKDLAAPPAQQHLSLYSARGDDTPQQALSGETIDYSPTLTAPGTNVRSLRDPSGDAQFSNPANDPSSANPPPGGEAYEPSYVPLTGTSMAAPHLTGAVAVVQSAAKARIRRLLTPAEVEAVMTRTAQPMTGTDALWDFPCPELLECGSADPSLGLTGQPYAKWQVGAGYLDVAAAVAAIQALPAAPAPPPPSTGGRPPANPGTGAGGGTGTGGGQGSGCVDSVPPSAGLRGARLVRGLGRIGLTGQASDRGCGGAARSVRVAVGRGVGGGWCRFVVRSAALGATRRCRRRIYLPARGVAPWRLVLRGLPPGRYLVWARATDGAGNLGRLEGARRVRIR